MSADDLDASTVGRERVGSHADTAGAALIVIGIAGGIAWVYEVVRTHFVDDGPISVGERVEQLAEFVPVLLLSAIAVGVGVGIRTQRAGQLGCTPLPFGRPLGRMLLGFALALAVVLAGAELVEDSADPIRPIDLDLLPSPSGLDDFILIEPSLGGPSIVPGELTHMLEVDADGCGVYRSGSVGDDLTWVVTDGSGFQVLGRNAAGETQYRYFRPGTYNVVLEAWGGSYYVAVSNVVTITC